MTAVEFLIEQFRIPNSDSYIFKTFQQALEMEKQQIIEACNYGDFEELGEQYFKQTFGS